jgi:hypothetical protein
MGHFSRMSERKSETPTEWLKVCADIGRLANEWAGRNDLAIYGGSDTANGEALAAFYADVAEIEINLPVAFGSTTRPEIVGDLNERSQQYEFPEATGVILHEATHARCSLWNVKSFDEVPDLERQAFWLLEEGRIERLAVIAYPKNVLFLRSSALNLALADTKDNLENLSEVRGAALLAALCMSRVDAGVLEMSDVSTIYKKLIDILGQELFDNLRSVWIDFQKLQHFSHADLDTGKALAKKWVELLREADPEGEPQEGGSGSAGEGDEGNEGGSGSALSELMEALAEASEQTASETSGDLESQERKEKWEQEAKVRSNQTKTSNKNKETANKVFSTSSGAGGEKTSRSKLVEVRKPTGQERAAAVTIAKMLERAKYRDRSKTAVKTHLPEGRLKTRVAIQNAALKSMGIHAEQPAWRKTARKRTENPTLTVGVMVDISGSMSSAMNPMATTAWVLSEAGRRIQAKTAMVYYGEGVFPTLKAGQHLSEVRVYNAPDGTEFATGFEALDGSLNLLYGTGARMLVVVSDGNYRSDQHEKATEYVRQCQQRGVAVLWISPENGYWSSGAKSIVAGTNAAYVEGLSADGFALEIGKAATQALEAVGKSQR